MDNGIDNKRFFIIYDYKELFIARFIILNRDL